jgi:hypothetical protein
MLRGTPPEAQWRRTRLLLAILLFLFAVPNAMLTVLALGSVPLAGSPIPSWVIELGILNSLVSISLGAYVVATLSRPRDRAAQDVYSGD